jgi:hypothetical protein
MGNESDGTLPLRAHHLRGGGRPGDGQGLSLHRLPETDRHGVSRRHREPAGDIRAEERDAEDLPQDRGEREQARPRLLPGMRHADHAAAPEPNPSTYGLRVGGIDQRAQLAPPARQIWCRSALPWSMDLTGIERIERQ